VTLEALAAETAPGQQAAALRARGAAAGVRGADAAGLWRQVMMLEEAAAAEVLGKAEVIAATCIGAGAVAVSSARAEGGHVGGKEGGRERGKEGGEEGTRSREAGGLHLVSGSIVRRMLWAASPPA
jgi:hypothetical protein